MCVCVCARVRACVRACVGACVRACVWGAVGCNCWAPTLDFTVPFGILGGPQTGPSCSCSQKGIQ